MRLPKRNTLLYARYRYSPFFYSPCIIYKYNTNIQMMNFRIFPIKYKYIYINIYCRGVKEYFLSVGYRPKRLRMHYWVYKHTGIPTKNERLETTVRGEEGQPHQSLVRTTFSSFSRPNHIEILVLSILFFLSVRSLKINTFF